MYGTTPKCPECGWSGAKLLIEPPGPGEGYDPLMVRLRCTGCGLKYWLAPAIDYCEPEKESAVAPPCSERKFDD